MARMVAISASELQGRQQTYRSTMALCHHMSERADGSPARHIAQNGARAISNIGKHAAITAQRHQRI